MQESMPMHDRWNDQLSEYLDDELGAEERAALEAHLASCDVCRRDLGDLRAVVLRARSLGDTPPATELWGGIAARIDGSTGTRAFRARETRRFAFTLPQLVAASLALIVSSGGLVWLTRTGAPGTGMPPGIADGPPAVRPANFGDSAYDQAIADLQRILEEDRGRLDAQTVQVLETNLATIDRAIAQCREALAGDPANVYLNTYLAQARARKLELLRRAAAIANSVS
jgi:tetratricopeptide (TPR) repeat protein